MAAAPSTIRLKRVYDPPDDADGCRVLVERLWPRGLAKARARVEWWAKDAAPSHDLRKWFDHDPDRWDAFVQRYHRELDANPAALEPIRDRLAAGPVTFVFASRETRFNNAVALRAYLQAAR